MGVSILVDFIPSIINPTYKIKLAKIQENLCYIFLAFATKDVKQGITTNTLLAKIPSGFIPKDHFIAPIALYIQEGGVGFANPFLGFAGYVQIGIDGNVAIDTYGNGVTARAGHVSALYYI